MKQKPVVVEAMYFGTLPIFSHYQWFKWKVYKDTKSAQKAVDSYSRRHKHFKFRIQDKSGGVVVKRKEG